VDNTVAHNHLNAGMDEIRSHWGWILTFGILLLLLGGITIIGDVTATFVTVLAFGWLLVFGGFVGLVHAFTTRTWSGFFVTLLGALLRGFTGFLMIRYPGVGAMTLTLFLATFFIVGGLFRAIGAEMAKFPRWGWSVVSGLVSVMLGIMLLAQWPVSSLWFIGFAIGVEMIMDGAALVGFATAIHNLAAPPIYRHA
jgi:uncharacterized membrane protein HdeD (DUF308 family)